MSSTFKSFKIFKSADQAELYESLLKENEIEFLLKKEDPSFNAVFGTKSEFEAELFIDEKDFGRIQRIEDEFATENLSEVDRDHYLFEFEDAELFEILTKQDEWSSFDVKLASKILNERGQNVDEELIANYKSKRLNELKKTEPSQNKWVLIGYISAVLGGLIALFIGWHLLSHKKSIPNGERVYAYSLSDRNHGNRIFWLGVFFIAFWITIRLIMWNKELN